MASAALTGFNAAIDGSALGAGAKAQIKALGQNLYHKAVREHMAHLAQHVESQLAASVDPDDQRVLAMVVAAVTAFASKDDFHVADLGSLLARMGAGESRWVDGLALLFRAHTREQAEAIFDVLLARAPASQERIGTKLLILRDIIDAKVTA